MPNPTRCWWPGDDPLYVTYHDEEWGRPVTDDTRLFEKICLEGFQAGLSWITILRKRENFRRAFDGFDPAAVSRFTARDVRRLLKDEGIVRHRGKIESTINNARLALDLMDEKGSLAAYLWSWETRASQRPREVTRQTLQQMSTTPQSVALSKDLKKRGWSFVGPTTTYAFMQAMGLVNDHVHDCYVRREIDTIRATLVRPGRRPLAPNPSEVRGATAASRGSPAARAASASRPDPPGVPRRPR